MYTWYQYLNSWYQQIIVYISNSIADIKNSNSWYKLFGINVNSACHIHLTWIISILPCETWNAYARAAIELLQKGTPEFIPPNCNLQNFVVNRFFMKLFKTNNIDVVKTCQQYFNFEIPITLWRKHFASFDIKFASSENIFCKVTPYSF